MRKRCEYRCTNCDYLFEDPVTPVEDPPECPICMADTLWILNPFDEVKATENNSPDGLTLFPEIIGETP